MTTWLEVAQDFARRHAISDEMADVLRAFVGPSPRGGPPPPHEMAWAGDFAALERACCELELERVARDLALEVDGAQAEMFERRVRAVDNALADLGDDTGRLLRVGLRHRLAGILAAPRPRASRVRALADFYFSIASRHRIARARSGGPSIAEMAAQATWEEIAPGARYALLQGRAATGPVHANLLRLEAGRVRLSVEDCRESAARGVSFAAHVRERGALAGVSGGFFLYSEPDIAPPSRRHDPVGLLMQGGEILNPPTVRRGSLVVDRDGTWSIGRIGMLDVEIEDRAGRRRPTWVVNRASGSHGPDEDSAAIVADRVIAVGRGLAVPLNGCVIPRGALEAGDRLIAAILHGPTGPVHSGIAGGPMLLSEGRPVLQMRDEDFWGTAPPVTFSQDETGDRNVLPRLAAGLAEGDLVLAAIDGRNFEHALGMTLGEVAELLAALGCHTATNLDGGSSKRMVVGGVTRDLPTTEIVENTSDAGQAIRPVYTGVLVFGEA